MRGNRMTDSTATRYADRVYAGVLGKILGVYTGRPVEGWSYDAIRERFGEVDYFVAEALGVPLVVPDDDISGTFVFATTMPPAARMRATITVSFSGILSL